MLYLVCVCGAYVCIDSLAFVDVCVFVFCVLCVCLNISVRMCLCLLFMCGDACVV